MGDTAPAMLVVPLDLLFSADVSAMADDHIVCNPVESYATDATLGEAESEIANILVEPNSLKEF